MVGMDGPKMSRSSSPTRKPERAAATARLTATVDLPTPPLADATATIPRAGRVPTLTVRAGAGGETGRAGVDAGAVRAPAAASAVRTAVTAVTPGTEAAAASASFR